MKREEFGLSLIKRNNHYKAIFIVFVLFLISLLFGICFRHYYYNMWMVRISMVLVAIFALIGFYLVNYHNSYKALGQIFFKKNDVSIIINEEGSIEVIDKTKIIKVMIYYDGYEGQGIDLIRWSNLRTGYDNKVTIKYKDGKFVSFYFYVNNKYYIESFLSFLKENNYEFKLFK